MKELREEISSIELEIGNSVVFPQDKKTLYYEQDNFIVKVAKKETLKWDQEKLNKARLFLGDETFLSLFYSEWKHKHRSVLDYFLKKNINAELIEDALSISNKFDVTLKQKT